MNTEKQVVSHYERGDLEAGVMAALQALGKPLEEVTPEEAAPVDEFHVGGVAATRELAAQMTPKQGERLLDVGSGIGGPARYFAKTFGCHVTGIDLTPEFTQVARRISEVMKLTDLTRFEQCSALHMPFADGAFDQAYMIHVGMNIEDKAGLMREVKRVLKPGGLFAVFDIMKIGPGEVQFPVPWARSGETSFVREIADYREAFTKAGFAVEHERVRRNFGLGRPDGPPPVGLSLFAGAEMAPVMARNISALMTSGTLSPVELFGRA